MIHPHNDPHGSVAGNSRGVSSRTAGDCIVLHRESIERLIDPLAVIKAVEQGYLQQKAGSIQLLDSVYAKTQDGIFAIKSALGPECLVIKQASLFGANASKGLPNLQAALSIFDVTNGSPIAILLDQGVLTNHRTAAAGAIGAKYLSREDSQKVLIVGSGGQAPHQLEYLTHVRDVRQVWIYSDKFEQAQKLAEELTHKHQGITVEACSQIEQGLAEADIIVTCTPSTKALFSHELVRNGTHINAIGSDRPGKQELQPALLARAKYVPDNAAQCAKVGELQHVSDEHLRAELVYAEIADLVCGDLPARKKVQEITIFDSTGLASQDYAIARLVLQRACQQA